THHLYWSGAMPPPGVAVHVTVAPTGCGAALSAVRVEIFAMLASEPSAMTMPAPESRSQPPTWMSTAPFVSRKRICAWLNDRFADLISAAIAAACGAAAD